MTPEVPTFELLGLQGLAAVSALAGLVVIGLTLLYLLRPRRRHVRVPYGGLWQAVLLESQGRALGRRWRQLGSWLLWLAVVCLLAGALAEPFWRASQPSAERSDLAPLVLIVDRSASMATRDGSRHAQPAGPQVPLGDDAVSRLREAIDRAKAMLGQRTQGEPVLVLAASSTVEVVAGWGASRAAARAALERLEASDGGLDLRQALHTAEAALEGRQGGQIVLLSDGGPPTQRPEREYENLSFVAVGPGRTPPSTGGNGPAPSASPHRVDNLAVVELRVRAQAGDANRGTLTVRVRNDSDRSVPARLAVASSDSAQLVAEFAAPAALRRVVEVEAPPGASVHTLTDVELSRPRIGVRVQSRSDGFVDRAAYDDWGLAVMPDRQPVNVWLVGQSNLFLEAALHANSRLVVRGLSPEAYAKVELPSPGAPDRPGIVVLNQVDLPAPEGVPSLTLLGPRPSDTQARHPELTVRAATHPAMRAVSFQDTNFDRVRILTPGPDDQVLAGIVPKGPVMLASSSGVRRLTWGLDLLETDLAMRYALPILIDNAAAWLAGQALELSPPLEPGRPWSVEVPSTESTWTWREPGRPGRPARRGAHVVMGTSEVHGVHVWSGADGKQVARPTALAATEAPALHEAPAKPWTIEPAVGEPSPQQASATPVWTWLIALAALVVCGEWAFYLRRRTA